MTQRNHLGALRAALAERGLDGFLIPRADEHLGEYIPASAERLRWLTGFTGSAGLAVVLRDRAAFFTDGRYQTQARAEVDLGAFELRHLIDEPPETWLAASVRAGAAIGYDPWLHSAEAVDRLRRAVERAGGRFVAVEPNPIDALWTDRPPPPASPVKPHSAQFAGEEAAAKRARIGAAIAAAGAKAAVLTAPDSIAWLFNIRADDVPFTPVALAYALLEADGRATLFLDPARVDPAARAHLGNEVAVEPRSAFPLALARLGAERATVLVDPRTTPARVAQRLEEAGATILAEPDPVALPKACKNSVEQVGARAAHRRDAVALIRFLAWLDRTAPVEPVSELAAAKRLLALRAEGDRFRGESFPAISAAGPNGAIIHYRVSEATNRMLASGDLYLIDSGGQYLDGTTDVTRTVLIGEPSEEIAEQRDRYTRVLKGLIAIATLRWPKGVAGPHLEAFARRALWQQGLDYDHGTGHGVGSYLGVHEGPTGLSRAARPIPLAPGMILSDEPGFYLPGRWGIRLENLVMVREEPIEGAIKPFLGFETLTLAPFDRRLIEPALLSEWERSWLDSYHARVAAEIGPLLDRLDRAWLEQACAPL
ncbi:aminopeptidase P family protein [Elioraea thermophila]|uniref:aminopeptidase P family protein n=1 Tax=Elioraea thermophila TaxID=2185104 RepID=UPI000DF1A6F9|nr:aminopeptidase P family protein [Elioraea thermophila]